MSIDSPEPFRIWVDADATPNPVKDILIRAAKRTGHPITFVANETMRLSEIPNLEFLLVEQGFDVADSEILRRLNPGDLVITADIPLAADVLAKNGHALNPRGEMYDPGTIKEKLAMRDLLSTLRDAGMAGGGPGAFGPRDKQAFANKLDSFLARITKRN